MIMQPLSDDSLLSQTVLPSVWAGYKKTPNFPTSTAVDQMTDILSETCNNISTEEASKIANHFWTTSLHDFCVRYFGQILTTEDHAKILQTANDIIKNGTAIEIEKHDTDLIKVLAAKVALNVHQRAHHAMVEACFLNEHGQLPKEDVFMLQKGISPIF